MNYRYIFLSSRYSGFSDEFEDKFRYNTYFISNYLSQQVRKLHLPADGEYNMFYCNVTKDESSIREGVEASLDVNLHVDESEISQYLQLSREVDRYEFYLSLLERGYRYASTVRDIPVDEFLKLHQQLRDNGYKNERLFKKKQLRDYGIKIELHHVLTTYSYNLILSIYDLHKHLLASGSIYETYPHYIYFNKTARHLVFEDGKMIITDFLDHPQFVCNLEDMAKGIIKSVCVDEDTQKYIPNEENMADFEILKW